MSCGDFLRRPEVTLEHVAELAEEFGGLPQLSSSIVSTTVEADGKLAGYFGQQDALAAKLGDIEAVKIPAQFEYRALKSLRTEAIERLERARPETLGQAARIPGITPTTLSIIQVHLAAAR